MGKKTHDRPRGSIPRSREDDYSSDMASERRLWLEDITGSNLDSLADFTADPHIFRGNIENFVGTIQLPVGVAGPLLIQGDFINEEVYIPLATNEGALVASYNRGMKALTLSGGVRTHLVENQLQVGVTFQLRSQAEALEFAHWAGARQTELKNHAETTTRHGRFLRVESYLLGPRAYLNFYYDTADALGVNMATVATGAATEWIMEHAQPQPSHYYLPGGMQGEKWGNALDYLHSRGRRVTAEVTLTRDVLSQQLHTSSDALEVLWRSMILGKLQSVGLGANFHIANAVTALYLACGQDAAYTSALTGVTIFEPKGEGDLLVSLDIPTLGVGTVGGGTGLPTASACLDLLGCVGPGKADRLAEIIAAACLAGEVSTAAAIVTREFVAAHDRLGRNRPS
jgi:hydroxymethylglutaryl-CoA reductase (NADPH)